MKPRGAWGRPFKFTAEQRDELRAILRRNDEAADNLLGGIQVLVPKFLMDYEVFAKQVSETPRESRALLSRIARNAKELSEDLENLDALGSAGAFDYGLSRLSRSVESLGYISEELILISAAAAGGVKFIGPAKRGRHASTTELQFIGMVGHLYQHHLKRRPSHSRGGQFTRFMSKVFLFVDPSNVRSHSDISKFCQTALAKLKPTNDPE